MNLILLFKFLDIEYKSKFEIKYKDLLMILKNKTNLNDIIEF